MELASVKIGFLTNVTWQPVSLPSVKPDNLTHIFRISINKNLGYLDKLLTFLTDQEIIRAKGYHREIDRQRFIISRACLRMLLGQFALLPANDLMLKEGDNKKPYLHGFENLHYNVSHSGNFILIAISDNPVGVDVEDTNAEVHYEDIMNICFSKPEREKVHGSAHPAADFYLLWTRKEALLKATGKGIDNDMVDITSLDGRHMLSRKHLVHKSEWFVNSFIVDKDHAGSIASVNINYHFWGFNVE